MTTKTKITIEDLKKTHKVKKSEELFDIRLPIDYQCPQCDKIIKGIDTAMNRLSYSRREDKEDIELALEKISDVEYELSGLSDEVEELRSAIIELRDWGIEWKTFAKELIEENNIDLENYLSI